MSPALLPLLLPLLPQLFDQGFEAQAVTAPRGVPDNLPGYGVDAAVARALQSQTSQASIALAGVQTAINVKNYGAVGDDAADDTAALDSAAAAALAQNRPLYIPPGTYRRTTAFDLRGIMRVEGHSMNTTIIKQMTANTAVILLGHARQVATNLQATY
jgi:hypothetical protein